MAVVALKSAGITNATATPRVLTSANLQYGAPHESIGLVALANGDSIGSTYRLFRVHSNDRVSSLLLSCTAITSGAADFGLYNVDDVSSGAVVDVDFWASAQSIASALVDSPIQLEAGAAGGLITNAEKRIWEQLGLTSDPNREYDVVMTLTAATTAAGTVVLKARTITGA